MGVVFLVSSALAVLGASLMVVRRHPIYGLLFLLLSFMGAAGVYYSLNATFLAVAQILVYAGAIAVLFLFVLMFVNLRRTGEEQLPVRVGSLAVYDPAAVPETRVEETDLWTFRPGAGVAALSLFIVMAWVIAGLPEAWGKPFGEITYPHGSREVLAANPELLAERAGVVKDKLGIFGSIKDFGQVMIRDYWLHFEVVGLIVLVGVIGAVVLGKRVAAIDAEKKASLLAAEEGAHGGGTH